MQQVDTVANTAGISGDAAYTMYRLQSEQYGVSLRMGSEPVAGRGAGGGANATRPSGSASSTPSGSTTLGGACCSVAVCVPVLARSGAGVTMTRGVRDRERCERARLPGDPARATLARE